MFYKLKGSVKSYAVIYAWLTAACLMIGCIVVCVRGGGILNTFFFADVTDVANDFFNCFPAVRGYGLGYWLVDMYPPLAKIFFLVVARIYSHNNIPLENTIRNSMTDPRMKQAAVVPFILGVLFVTLVVVILVAKQFKKDENAAAYGASIACSYSVIWAIERGNIIYPAFMFALFFVLYYRSENKIVKELALISLAISAGLKLYPAAFGLLLLTDRRWKDALRAVIYGILSVLIPFVVVGIIEPRDAVESQTAGTLNYIEWSLQGLRQRLHGVGEIAVFGTALVLAFIFVCVLLFKGKDSKLWMKAFFAGVGAMTIGLQYAYAYSFLFLLPALVLFLTEEDMTRKNTVYFILFCMINLPLPIFRTIRGVSAVEHIKLLSILITMITIPAFELKNLLAKRR